jgi:hypothetical protein
MLLNSATTIRADQSRAMLSVERASPLVPSTRIRQINDGRFPTVAGFIFGAFAIQ